MSLSLFKILSLESRNSMKYLNLLNPYKVDIPKYIEISTINLRKPIQWKNVIFVINQIKFIIESDLKNIRLGYFVAKFVGKQYLNMKNIVMEVQESLSEIKIPNWPII